MLYSSLVHGLSGMDLAMSGRRQSHKRGRVPPEGAVDVYDNLWGDEMSTQYATSTLKTWTRERFPALQFDCKFAAMMYITFAT